MPRTTTLVEALKENNQSINQSIKTTDRLAAPALDESTLIRPFVRPAPSVPSIVERLFGWLVPLCAASRLIDRFVSSCIPLPVRLHFYFPSRSLALPPRNLHLNK